MLSNFRSLFRPNPPPAPPAPPVPAGAEGPGGANAFLAQSMQEVQATAATARGDRTIPTNRANENLLLAVKRGLVPAEVAPLLFPVGLVSGDGSVKLGREGFFLETESGTWPSRYLADPLSLTLEATVTRWLDLLLRRSHSMADLGVGFAGTILPSKLTLLADYFPETIVVPPPLMAALEVRVAEQIGLAGAIESVLPELRADPGMKHLYRRIDPGLTPYGAWRMFQIMLDRLGIPLTVNVNFAARKLVRPYLGDQFFDIPVFEEIDETDSVKVLRAASGVTAQPDPYGYEGWRLWHNDQAPIDRIIQVFGDPILGTPEQGQTAIAWWFATFFRELQLSHQQRYDHGYTTDKRPSAAIFVHTEEGIEGPPLS